MKITVLMFALFCLCLAQTSGEIIIIGNESITVELIVEDTCQEELKNIFYVERLNHSTGVEPLSIKYSTFCAGVHTTISKSINKYTRSSTGMCFFNQSGQFQINFDLGDQQLSFEHSVICEEDAIIASNTTNLQETLPTQRNTSTNLSQYENSTNHQQHTTDNASNHTIVGNETSHSINQTTQEESEELPTICSSRQEIFLNKQVFRNGEQLTLDFLLQPKPDEYEIDYWIETYSGIELKKRRTSSNTATKRHTFKGINEGEQGAYVKVIISDSCGTYEHESLLLLVKEEDAFKDEDEDTTVQASINILSVEQQAPGEVMVDIDIQRGSSRSSVVYLQLETAEGKTISQEKIKLLKTQSSVNIKTILPSYEETNIWIFARGLNQSDETFLVVTPPEKNEPKTLEECQTSNNITKKSNPKKKEETLKVAATNNKKEQVLKNSSVLPVLLRKTPSSTILSSTPHKALYGLFGSVLAGSFYFLLREK